MSGVGVRGLLNGIRLCAVRRFLVRCVPSYCNCVGCSVYFRFLIVDLYIGYCAIAGLQPTNEDNSNDMPIQRLYNPDHVMYNRIKY